MESNAPPRLQRKCPIPLPLSTPSPLVLNTLPCEEGAEPKRERSLILRQPSRRPSLHVTIPGTEDFLPWLDGSVHDSPLVCFTELSAHIPVIDIPTFQSGIDPDAPPPSVLLNASAIRAYLDSVHGPHNISSQPQSPQLAYPRSPELAHPQPFQLAYPQSPLEQLIPSKPVKEISAELIMHEGDMRRQNNRKSLFAMALEQLSDPYAVPQPSTLPKLHVQSPRSTSALKRQASQDDIVTPKDSLKVLLFSELIGIDRPS